MSVIQHTSQLECKRLVSPSFRQTATLKQQPSAILLPQIFLSISSDFTHISFHIPATGHSLESSEDHAHISAANGHSKHFLLTVQAENHRQIASEIQPPSPVHHFTRFHCKSKIQTAKLLLQTGSCTASWMHDVLQKKGTSHLDAPCTSLLHTLFVSPSCCCLSTKFFHVDAVCTDHAHFQH